MARPIKIKKTALLEQIKANKENHLKDYAEAVTAYKIEAEKQLQNQLKALENGSLKIELKLITPSNKSDEYDKWIKTFEWEIDEEIILSQSEFNEYVLDEAPFAIQSKFLNSSYK